ncbi:hypothetical protein [Methylocystis sp.]|uniref:hypothetical protein n=1 Tax=Methylocystis sp. TaxID=1911079 RepID=UPI00273759D8|nr:hypothetical protein [Methylocystis sp.]MDP3553161.1 hypothetical protein [Methylocystis sp.]
MPKRIAFIGLSGPLFYDYANPAKRTHADLASSPNPILAAPISLMLLFDELWFLTKSLCPNNLRNSSFVKFVDESGHLDDLDPRDAEKWVELNSSELQKTAYDFIRAEFFDHYQTVLKSTGVIWKGACDNHSHGLKIGPCEASANSASFKSVLFDLFVHAKLGDPRVELIANPYLERLMEKSIFPAGRLNFSERVIGPRLTNWQSPVGPYQPEIDDLRHHRFLKDYRTWVQQQDISFDEKEASERREAVEREISSAMRKALLDKLDDGSLVKNSALLLGKAALDFATGGISGHLSDAAEAVKKTVETRSMRWQGFLLDLERTQQRS